MTAFQKYFSGRTILLALILELFCLITQAPLLVSYSDACNVACGDFVVGTNEVSHRMWSPCEAAKSSAWRELKAIHFALTSFKHSTKVLFVLLM